MSDSVARLLARGENDYVDFGHLAYWINDLKAVALSCNYVAALATQAGASATAANAALATMQALGASAYGIGIDPTCLLRSGVLGSGAFVDYKSVIARRVSSQNAAYQITPQDFENVMLLTPTTGAGVTYTLPPWSSLPEFCASLPGKNRSGFNLTLAPQATDQINGGTAGTSITIATGVSWDCFWSPTANNFEVRVYS